MAVGFIWKLAVVITDSKHWESPAGAADQLAFNIAHILLGEPENYRCLEIIYPPKQIVLLKR